MSNRLSLFVKVFVCTLMVGIGLLHTIRADAATMSLNSSVVKVTEGSTFTVSVSVNTQGKTINNAEASISYPNDIVEVVSLGYGSSIFTLWAEVPSFSNSNGVISFNGGIPNPGYTGSGGVMSVTFRAKKVGNASIALSGVAIRENDGLGTNIFSGQRNISIEVATKPVEPPKEKEDEAEVVPPRTTPTTTPETVATTTPIIPVEESKAPEITYFSASILEGEQIEIQGISKDVNSPVSIVLKSQYGKIFNYDVGANAGGNFTFMSEPMTTAGSFELYVYSTNADGTKSPISKTITIEVKSVAQKTDLSALNIPVLPALAISLIILLALLNVFSLYKILSLKRQYGHMEEKSRKVFKLLIARASRQIEALEKTKKNGSLTTHGQAAVKELREVIEQLEDFDNSNS